MEGIMISLQGQMSSQHQANIGHMLRQRQVNVAPRPMGDIHFGMCHRRWPEMFGDRRNNIRIISGPHLINIWSRTWRQHTKPYIDHMFEKLLHVMYLTCRLYVCPTICQHLITNVCDTISFPSGVHVCNTTYGILYNQCRHEGVSSCLGSGWLEHWRDHRNPRRLP